ncbi:MAG: hypothetical protein WAO69_11995, partial [Aestuariivita sp.]|uniref:hypothetical protein n=1 Tax=Aestuariivita sp. TaxID=1872407 RepID=UPI003BB218A6
RRPGKAGCLGIGEAPLSSPTVYLKPLSTRGFSDVPYVLFQDGLAPVTYPADGKSWERYSYIDREGAVVWHQEG